MPRKTSKDNLARSPRLSPRIDNRFFGGQHRANPAIRYSSESIEEMSQEEILPRIKELQERGEPFEKIISFYIGKRKLTETQTKKWLAKFNEFREERSLSSLPGDVETCSSSEIRNLKYPKESVARFYSRLCSQSNWNIESSLGSKLPSRSQGQHETSSESECEEIPRKTRQSTSRVRKGSWKEYKETKDLGEFLTQNTENPGVKKLVKMTIKELWKQKKSKNIKEDKNKIIEVDKVEVADMIYEVTEHMTKKYLPLIRDLATKIDPATDDRPDSECESGSYDSQDEFYPHREDKRSKLPKYAMAVNPDVLINHGLYEILLVTLPLCATYSDSDQLEDFIDILKEAKDTYTVPKALSLRGTLETSDKQSVKERHKSKMLAFKAEVNPSPSTDTLSGIHEIELSEKDEESDTASSKSASADIRERLRRETLQSIASEDSQSVSVFDETASDSTDLDACAAEEVSVEKSDPNPLPIEDESGQVKRERSPKQDEKPAKKSTKE